MNNKASAFLNLNHRANEFLNLNQRASDFLNLNNSVYKMLLYARFPTNLNAHSELQILVLMDANLLHFTVGFHSALDIPNCVCILYVTKMALCTKPSMS